MCTCKQCNPLAATAFKCDDHKTETESVKIKKSKGQTIDSAKSSVARHNEEELFETITGFKSSSGAEPKYPGAVTKLKLHLVKLF